MKKIVLFILLSNSVIYTQNIDPSFNSNNSGPYNENMGGYGTVMSDGNIITNNYANLYNSNGGVINNPATFLNQIGFTVLVNGYNNKLVAFNRNDLGLKVYNYDGSEVTTFISPVFTSALSPTISSAKMEPDGKIVVSGFFNEVNGVVRKNMVRLNADGSVDTTFINVDDNFTLNGSIYSFARQSDGKYIIGGQFYSGFTGNYHNVSLTRLNNDGTIDATFFDFAGTSYGYGLNADIEKILLLADGKIVIIGPNFKNGSTILSTSISRLNSDGSRDSSFNTSGISGYGNDGLLLPDAKILFIYNGDKLKKLHPNGTIDNSFNYQNTVYYYESFLGLQLCPDNKILVNCQFKSAQGITREKMHKIDISGALDYTFNPQQSTNKPIQNMAVFRDGSIIAESSNLTAYNDSPCKSLIKLTSEGIVDTSFNLDTQVEEFPDAVIHIKEFYNNKILIAVGINQVTGSSIGNIYVNSTAYKFIRLNGNGTYDNTFNPAISVDLRYSEILGNDKILYRNYSDNRMYRLNYDGSNDATFTPYTFYSNKLFKKFNDGSIYISGAISGSLSKVYKLDTGGIISSTFNCYNYLNYNAIEFQKQDDKLVVAYNNGGTNSYIRRLNSDGTLDAAFTGFTTPCDKIIINSENKIFIINGSLLKRYSTDGVLEQTTDFGFTISKIYQQSCDKLLIQGNLNLNLNNYNGNSDNLKRYGVYSSGSLVNPPTGESIQFFSTGDRLQDLTVIGQNILWYDSQPNCGLNMNNNRSPNSNIPLPANTILVNNTTYYASQTVNYVESTYRLPVTASLSLNTSSHNISIFKVINPVKDLLKIYGNIYITKVEIYSLIGSNLKKFNINNGSKNIEIDLKDLTPNVYIVKIFSDEGVETKKIIKE